MDGEQEVDRGQELDRGQKVELDGRQEVEVELDGVQEPDGVQEVEVEVDAGVGEVVEAWGEEWPGHWSRFKSGCVVVVMDVLKLRSVGFTHGGTEYERRTLCVLIEIPKG